MDIENEIAMLKGKLIDVENRLAKLEGQPISQATTTKKISVKEFILTKAPKDSNQKALLIGYHLEKNEACISFNISDLTQGFTDAKETPPSNISDRVNQLIRKGWMMKVKEKKDKKTAWVLTNNGERAVQNGFVNEK